MLAWLSLHLIFQSISVFHIFFFLFAVILTLIIRIDKNCIWRCILFASTPLSLQIKIFTLFWNSFSVYSKPTSFSCTFFYTVSVNRILHVLSGRASWLIFYQINLWHSFAFFFLMTSWNTFHYALIRKSVITSFIVNSASLWGIFNILTLFLPALVSSKSLCKLNFIVELCRLFFVFLCLINNYFFLNIVWGIV